MISLTVFSQTWNFKNPFKPSFIKFKNWIFVKFHFTEIAEQIFVSPRSALITNFRGKELQTKPYS